MLTDILTSKYGKIVFSIIWGLGLAVLFKKTCEGKSCKIYKYVSPNIDEIKNKYYNYGTLDCYKYDPIITKC